MSVLYDLLFQDHRLWRQMSVRMEGGEQETVPTEEHPLLRSMNARLLA